MIPEGNPRFRSLARSQSFTVREKRKIAQACGLLGGQGLDYCQTRTDTIQATCHVQAYRNTYQHFSNRVKVKYFDRPIIRKPPVHRHLQNKATICAHDTLFQKDPSYVSSWFGCWRAYLCYVLDWVLAGKGAPHALHSVCMLRPNQAGGLQGSLIVRRDILAANDLGNGSGWKQSKQNWALPAVVGPWTRMRCSDLC